MMQHRLWAGTVLLLAALMVRTVADGGWSLALVVGLGVVLILTSFERRETM